MKNKKTLYLLVPLVVGLWGLIGYRIWSTVQPTEEAVEPIALAPISRAAVDTAAVYVPTLNYADPFLKGIRFQARSTPSASTTPKPKPTTPAIPEPTPEPPKVWPVRYQGYVLEGGKPSVAMLAIDTTFASLGLGQSLQGYTLKALRLDSVQLEHQSETRWFRRQ